MNSELETIFNRLDQYSLAVNNCNCTDKKSLDELMKLVNEIHYFIVSIQINYSKETILQFLKDKIEEIKKVDCNDAGKRFDFSYLKLDIVRGLNSFRNQLNSSIELSDVAKKEN
jgi:hypothetical protein